MIHVNSAILWNAFIAGPHALGAVEDVMLTDTENLIDLHTGLHAFAGNIFLEAEKSGLRAHDIQDGLKELRIAIRGRLDARRVRQTLNALQEGIGRWSEQQRSSALARVQRINVFSNPADIRAVVPKTLGMEQESRPIAGKISHVVVHQSQNRADFAAAMWGQISLYYSSRPVGEGDCSEDEFDSIPKFFVPSSKAMELFEQIESGVKPEDIIRKLGLMETHRLEVHRRIEDMRIAHGWRPEHALLP
ncbi:MAG: hypothetical protein HY609_05000 [Deltaproteobacteria bacterium]|nr:hypothetical protein [Deltaproteobacteria bacterium]MBI4224270.1 hypothetical protein [Deltaproteobacteria bacterium]